MSIRTFFLERVITGEDTTLVIASQKPERSGMDNLNSQQENDNL
jgi:hypothetical protein